MSNTILDTYDIIRLRHELKKPTHEILKENYLNFYLGISSGLPVVNIDTGKLNLISPTPWHSDRGSAIFGSIVNWLVSLGFFAPTKTNQKTYNDKIVKGLYPSDSKVMMFLGNLLYNFDSFNTFSQDPRVAKTIYDENATEEDFIYVLNKVFDVVKGFTNMMKNNEPSEIDFQTFIDSLVGKGGEIN